MNPMSFIGDGKTTVALHWYIRHGARDRDTVFPIPVNFATKLQNAGKDVDFCLLGIVLTVATMRSMNCLNG